MKINKLEIYGYGKWVNQTFDFNDQMVVIYGQNEAGKSTIQSFIRSILFGFPSRHRRINQINRYEPRKGDLYGGRIFLSQTKLGDLWVERTLAGVSVINEAGEELGEKALDQILAGLDENLFNNFYAFDIQNLQEIANIDAEKLSDYFLSIGTLGSDKFLSVAKKFDKDADELYKLKAKKPVLNQLLVEYDQLGQAIDRMRDNLSRYDQLLAEQNLEIEAIDQLNQSITQLEEELRQVDKLIGRYDIYQKDLTAKQELDRLVYTDMEDKLVENFEEANQSLRESENIIIQMEERIRQLNVEMAALTRLNWARNHEDDRRRWVKETAHIKDVQTRLDHVHERIQEQTLMMKQIALEGQFYPDKVQEIKEYDELLQNGYGIQAKIDELQGQSEDLKSQRKVYLDQRKELQTYSATTRQQIAKLESQRLNEKAQLEFATSLKHYFMGAIILIIGILLMAWYYFKTGNQALLWSGTGLAGLGLISILYVGLQHHKHHQNYRNSPAVDKISELRDKEQQYQERSQGLGWDINQREAALRQVNDELQIQHQNQQRWLVSIGFYPTADPDLILKSNPVKTYQEAEEVLLKYQDERNRLVVEIAKWQRSIEVLLARFPFEDISQIRALIRHVEETEVSLARQEERGRAMEERMQNAQEIISQQKLNENLQKDFIEQALQKTNSFDEIDFFNKVQTNQTIQELKEKRSLYADQIAGYEEALEKIPNKQSLAREYSDFENQLIQNKNRLQPHHHQRANLTVAINQLEQDGSYQDLLQEQEDKKAEIQSLLIEWGANKVAMNLIYQTLRQGMDNPVPEMNKMANEIFSMLTYGRYKEILLKPSGIKVQQFSDLYFQPHELSQGTLEQLYVALRLAFVENAANMVDMPILIDDAFVNFDEVRKTSMYHVLDKISKDHQILFFTFDQQAKEFFQESQQGLIDLDTMKMPEDNEIIPEEASIELDKEADKEESDVI